MVETGVMAPLRQDRLIRGLRDRRYAGGQFVPELQDQQIAPDADAASGDCVPSLSSSSSAHCHPAPCGYERQLKFEYFVCGCAARQARHRAAGRRAADRGGGQFGGLRHPATGLNTV